jgi:hypothetical protein
MKGLSMESQHLDQIIKQAERLTSAERLMLAKYLIEKAQKEMPPKKTSRKWSEVIGLIHYPALGEDAQTYISRTREYDDNHRIQNIRDGK